jgi:hypothetical protein
MVDTTMIENIFEDFDQQDFANSQEYFDYLKKQAEGYKAFKTSPEQVQQDKDAALDLAKFLPNVAAEAGNTLIGLGEIPFEVYNLFQEEEDDKITLPRFPKFEYTNEELGYVDTAAGLLLGGGLGFLKGLNLLADKSPKAYAALREAYPYTVGQIHDSMKQKGFGFVKELIPRPEITEKIARNLVIATGAGLATTTGEPDRDEVIEDDGVISISPSDLEDDSPPNVRGSEMYEKQPEIVDRKAMGGEPSLETDIFEESDVVTDGPEEVQMANLFGRVPIWAIGKADKSKVLTQDFSKAIKKALESIKNKLGTKDEVLGEAVEDIDIIDTPSGETAVGAIKSKKTIIDSPEPNESVFYSELEARLMDPNTPKTFNSKEELFNFLNQKGISKAEVEDNILNRYIDIANKNKTPIAVDDMLEIVRQAPMRKVQSVTYGDPRYGGTKNAKYDGYQESGALPGSYREEVLYLPAEDIPLDPKTLPMSGHDFSEKYVIGWSRLTDRKATLPVEKTPQGIAEQVDPAMIRTLKRNQKTLDRQLIGLEVSALRKLNREFPDQFGDDLDSLTRAEVRNVLDQGDTMAKLNSVDPALEQQILQFRMKIDSDAAKLQKMEATTKGQQVTVTFADEVQSDILQQAKRMEENFLEKLADLMDKNKDVRANTIAAGQRGYRDEYRGLNPEVAEFFIENKSVFRPIFQTAQDMQQFLDEFTKTQKAISALGDAGLRPDPMIVRTAQAARKKQAELLSELKTSLSKESMQMLMPNVPFKNRSEWGSALIKMNVNNAAKRLFIDKADDAAEWFAISPSKLITKRYGQSGGTNVPPAERTKDMKGIGMEEFYGGPSSTDYKGKHYTSVLEKEMKRLARENNSEFKVIKIDNVGDAFAVKLTPEMLLPHKTHRKKGGMVYTPEIIDIFEAA